MNHSPVRHSRSINVTGSRDEYGINDHAGSRGDRGNDPSRPPGAARNVNDFRRRRRSDQASRRTGALQSRAEPESFPDDFAIIGVDHDDQTTEEWRQSLTEMMQALMRVGAREHQLEAIDEQAWSWLIRRMHYLRGDFTQPETL